MLADRSLNHTHIPFIPNYLSQNSLRPELLVAEMDVLRQVIRDGGSMFLVSPSLLRKNLACKLISVCLNKDPVKLALRMKLVILLHGIGALRE